MGLIISLLVGPLVFGVSLLVGCLSGPRTASADSVEEFASHGLSELTYALNNFLAFFFLCFVVWFGISLYEVSTQDRLPPFCPAEPRLVPPPLPLPSACLNHTDNYTSGQTPPRKLILGPIRNTSPCCL